MIPIRFGAPGRQCFGMYHPASGAKQAMECVVLCNPYGREAIRCHRLFKILADRLSRGGLHVLRFDLFGTGDSDGGDLDGGIDAWIDDLLRADEEVARRSGCSRVSWVGLRLGTSIAAIASEKIAGAPKRLVLWDPVTDGASYLAELANSHISAAKVAYGSRWETEAGLRKLFSAESESGAEALGFALAPTLCRQLQAMTLSSFALHRAARVALIGGRDSRLIADLRQHLIAGGIDVAFKPIGAEIDWTLDAVIISSIASTEALQGIASFLLEDR
ncbi:MAG: hypothetical protein EXR28_00560 [Betaproteobacteria bacterium]|nr:hypothetical protein [Betaproteobacteria bacterium]